MNAQIESSKRVDYVSIKLDRCLLLVGDVKIEFSCTQLLKPKQKLFHYWFNTYFINQIIQSNSKYSSAHGSLKFLFFSSLADPEGNVIFELDKPHIDDAHKDKQKMFNENFKVSLNDLDVPK
jgi:phosphatidylinositol-3,4,5-trisphosphate 3-phosphatase/dual-specificity protein phosphatase PTEN